MVFKISRREFLNLCSGAILTNLNILNMEASAIEKQGVVVVAKNDKVQNRKNEIDADILSVMLQRSIQKLMGTNTAKEAWSKLFAKEDRVGIKVNCLASPKLSPKPHLINSIIEGLKLAGVKEENILIWDRSNSELERGGFKINTSIKGVKCFGTDAIEGGGFEQELSSSGSLTTCLSMILTKFCTALINVGVLKDHDIAGVGAAMKNLYGVIHNPNKYHDNNCNPYLADLCNMPGLRNKLRLNICDGLTAQYNGGPAFKPQWSWNFNGIIIAQDIVALDSIVYKVIEDKRKSLKMPSLKDEKREPAWLKTADNYGIGISDINKINLIEL